MLSSLLPAFFALGVVARVARPSANNTYEYIVVGSGPGGSPLAVNLARAGHSVLLLDAGDDQSQNLNVSILGNFLAADNDPATRWDFFVKHTDDDSTYERMTYRTSSGDFYVGTSPPAGATKLGIYYPRAGTLGGCAMHNGGIATLPGNNDWDNIAVATKDDTWRASNMRKYFEALETCLYCPKNASGHGFNGFLQISAPSGDWAAIPSDGRKIAVAAAEQLNQTQDVVQLLNRDINGNEPNRDQETGFFTFDSHGTNAGMRSSGAYYVLDTIKEGKYPLTLQLESLVTKVLFNNATTGSLPKAIGVEYLQGKSLYSADPRYKATDKGMLGRAYATKEVIVAGGAFNSPQILKLSGIGPAEELKKFNIPVVADLPGVGEHLSDNYEGGFLSTNPNITGSAGQLMLFLKTAHTNTGNRDIQMWCGQFSFEGFWPGFPENYPAQYECAFVHMNPRTPGGFVRLRSADPRDTPEINFKFWEEGAENDLQALLEAAKYARGFTSKASAAGVGTFKEKHPCTNPSGVCTDEEQMTFIKEQTYSHHATSTCAIGSDDNKWAVLDSKFRVRGVQGLRVVDASAFPKVPGAFPVLPTFVLSMKATEEILASNMAGK